MATRYGKRRYIFADPGDHLETKGAGNEQEFRPRRNPVAPDQGEYVARV
ncbi:hypothetical protein [Streptomyces sp. BE133]|nr:hypothetical protein [Streptomyces sp. BE133]